MYTKYKYNVSQVLNVYCQKKTSVKCLGH